jgi:putative transposase
MHKKTVQADILYCEETIRKLMIMMNMKASVYSRHTAKYSSYKGTIGHRWLGVHF